MRQGAGGSAQGAQGGGERAEVGGEGEARCIHIPPRPDSNMKPNKKTALRFGSKARNDQFSATAYVLQDQYIAI